MWNKKTFTVLCSLALAGSMAVPAFAARRDLWTGGLDCGSVRIGCGGEADRDCG